jgi:hypothetical protein
MPWKRLLAAVMLLLCVVAPASGSAASPTAMTIADFTFADTSGEARDQRGEHEARLQALAARLRHDLEASGKFRIVDVTCAPAPCAADVGGTAERARRAGARFVLFGAVHKTSTLVLSIPIQVIDAGTGKVVFGRLHSFRGDSDEAWQRAGRFLVRELIDNLVDK